MTYLPALLAVSDASTDATIQSNMRRTAAYIDELSAVIGAPLRVTSGYRNPAHNAAVGGSSTSDHTNGLAADVAVLGVSQYEAYQKIKAADQAGRLSAWDQFIFYPVDGHLHVGLGYRLRKEIRLGGVEGGYPFLTADTVSQLRGYV